MEKNTEKIRDSNGDTIAEVYTNEIYSCLDEYCQNNGIEDLREISQSRWNAILIYLHECIFEGTDKLKREPYTSYEQENGRRRNWKASNNNAYDTDTVKAISDIYIYMCFSYEKECSIFGFSLLTGVSRTELYNWRNDPNSSGFIIVKNIMESREETLSAKLYSSKGSPVGILGILNHWYGWNMPGNNGSGESKPARSIEEIQAQYTQEIETNNTEGGESDHE